MKTTIKTLLAATSLALMSTAASAATVTSPNFNVNVTVTSTCAITTNPGDITLAYTDAQAGPATGTTTFALRCTNTLPYSLSFTAAGGTVAGLAYTLAASGQTAAGTGAAQTVTVTATAAGGQSITCATATCSGSQAHTVTVTY
ncbi:MAG TPA: spore coat protein U domain-containing protein [Usitatibacter sp.]|nr:spore coat protein U domain-containing protein [Usitatibacter sp.]